MFSLQSHFFHGHVPLFRDEVRGPKHRRGHPHQDPSQQSAGPDFNAIWNGFRIYVQNGRGWEGRGKCRGHKVLTLEHSMGAQSSLTRTGKAQWPKEKTQMRVRQPCRPLQHHPSIPDLHSPQPRPPGGQKDPAWPAGKVQRRAVPTTTWSPWSGRPCPWRPGPGER